MVIVCGGADPSIGIIGSFRSCSAVTKSTVLTEPLKLLYLMWGLRKFISLLHYILLYLTRLLTRVSVVIPVRTQVFYISKAETGTQVLPWPVVPLLSLGRAQFQTGMNPLSLCFEQGTYMRVRRGQVRWVRRGATCFAGRRALLVVLSEFSAVSGCSPPSPVNPAGII